MVFFDFFFHKNKLPIVNTTVKIILKRTGSKPPFLMHVKQQNGKKTRPFHVISKEKQTIQIQ
jgi:hypothetical protein